MQVNHPFVSEVSKATSAALSCVEELVLLAHDEDTGRLSRAGRHGLRFPVAGAVLLELALQRRLEVEGESLVVIDPTPTGVAYLDRTLADLDAAPGKQDTTVWIDRIALSAEAIQDAAIERLIERGILRRKTGRSFGVFPRRSYPSACGATERRIKRRLVNALLSDDTPSPREAALVSVVASAGLLHAILSRREARRAASRANELREGHPIGTAVSEAIHRLDMDLAWCRSQLLYF